jgi:hypothetical protein
LEPYASAPVAGQRPVGPSRGIVSLAMLFSVDSFAGGLVVNSLLRLAFEKFEYHSVRREHFFWTGLWRRIPARCAHHRTKDRIA